MSVVSFILISINWDLCVSNEPGVDEPNGAAGCLHTGRNIRVKIHAANAASARRSLRIRAD